MSVKKLIRFTLLSVFLISALLSVNQTVKAAKWYDNGPIIHAAGRYKGHTYTNSVEALKSTLKKYKGKVTVELDFSITRDGYPVCVHDWYDFNVRQNHRKSSRPLTLKQFKRSRTSGNGTPMTAFKAIKTMSKYKNCYLVVDTKNANLKIYRYLVNVCKNLHRKSFLKQIVIQVYHKKDYKKIKRIYPFRHWCFSAYKSNFDSLTTLKDLRSFCLKKNFDALTIPACTLSYHYYDRTLTRFKFDKRRWKALKYGRNLPILCHTVNSRRIYRILRYNGVKNVYTDQLK